MRRPLVEPRGPEMRVVPVWTEPDGLDDTADRAVGDEIGRHRHRRNLEPFGEIDRPDAARVRDRPAQLRELLRRHAARLVDHDVLAVRHRGDRKSGARRRHGRDQHEVDRRVLEDGPPVGDARQMREALAETRCGTRVAFRPPGDGFAADIEHTLQHAVDVTMVDTKDPDTELAAQAHLPAPATRTRAPVREDSRIASIRRWTSSADRPVIDGARPAAIAAAKSSMTARCAP